MIVSNYPRRKHICISSFELKFPAFSLRKRRQFIDNAKTQREKIYKTILSLDPNFSHLLVATFSFENLIHCKQRCSTSLPFQMWKIWPPAKTKMWYRKSLKILTHKSTFLYSIKIFLSCHYLLIYFVKYWHLCDARK